MDTSSPPETIDQQRRRLLGMATLGSAAAGAASLLTSRLTAAPMGDAIRPFRIDVPEEALIDLRRRLAQTRWPDRETVVDESQGVQLATMQELARYWGTDYDWRKCEAKLKAISAARYYWESHINLYNAADVSVPAAVTVFPGENYQAPRSWAERAYHKLIYYNKVDQGGHYAAWEQPQLFSAELRAGFRPLRRSI
jgi:pimeloyl-ACP methyl ester carboxylesterase